MTNHRAELRRLWLEKETMDVEFHLLYSCRDMRKLNGKWDQTIDANVVHQAKVASREERYSAILDSNSEP